MQEKYRNFKQIVNIFYNEEINEIKANPVIVPKVKVIKIFGNARRKLSQNSILRTCLSSMPMDSSMDSSFLRLTMLLITVLIKLKILNSIINIEIPYICICNSSICPDNSIFLSRKVESDSSA